MKHKHSQYIYRLMMYFDSECLLRKDNNTNIWYLCESGTTFPSFHEDNEYRVVAKQYVDMALLYYNNNTVIVDRYNRPIKGDPEFNHDVVYCEGISYPKLMKRGDLVVLFSSERIGTVVQGGHSYNTGDSVLLDDDTKFSFADYQIEI